MTRDDQIIQMLEQAGIDVDRLGRCLASDDNWGRMVHAFEYLTVCEAVLGAMKARDKS